MKIKSMKTILMLLLIIFSVLFCSGCGINGCNIKPENVYIKKPGDTVKYETIGEADFKKYGFGLLGIPIFVPNINAAFDNDIQNKGADAIINVSLQSDLLQYLLVINFTEYKLNGTYIKFTD